MNKIDTAFFANKIKGLRKIRGLSQEELAARCGIKQGNFSRWERGEVVPGLDVAVRIADYFGVSLDSLVGRDKNALKAEVQKSNIKDFIEIMEGLHKILMQEGRRDVIEGLRGLVKDLAERRGVKDVSERMSRKKYAK